MWVVGMLSYGAMKQRAYTPIARTVYASNWKSGALRQHTRSGTCTCRDTDDSRSSWGASCSFSCKDSADLQPASLQKKLQLQCASLQQLLHDLSAAATA